MSEAKPVQPWLESTAAACLRELQETVQTLSGTVGFKAMLRRFADILAGQFGVRCISFVRIKGSGAGKKIRLRRRPIRMGVELGTHDDAIVESLAMALGRAQVQLQAFREGAAAFSVDGTSYILAIVDDPHAREGCLLFWSPPSPPTSGEERALQDAKLDFIVRHLQNEACWYRKLDKTQAQLYRDDLTGLYNSRYLEIALDAELRRAQRFGSQFSLLFIDLDGFKPINDVHGHLSGSSVLKQVADVIRDAVREVDVALRYGGDEFVVVLLGATSAKGLLAAERVRRHIEAKDFELEDGTIVHLTASIGVASYPEHGTERETLLRRADETMYNSKRAGKNRVTLVGEPNSQPNSSSS